MKNRSHIEKHTIPFRDGEYVGELRNGLPHGVGMYTCLEYTYIGSWFYGTRSGLGVLHYPDGSIYKGEFYANDRHGQGEENVVSPACKSRYIGGWKNGKKHGRGTETAIVGGESVRRDGVWKNDTYQASSGASSGDSSLDTSH